MRRRTDDTGVCRLEKAPGLPAECPAGVGRQHRGRTGNTRFGLRYFLILISFGIHPETVRILCSHRGVWDAVVPASSGRFRQERSSGSDIRQWYRPGSGPSGKTRPFFNWSPINLIVFFIFLLSVCGSRSLAA